MSTKGTTKKSTKSDGGVCKMQKYPTIIEYLQSNEPAIYEIIECLNMRSSFTPRRGSSGITFLVPTAKYVEEIKKQMDGTEPETALDMMFSLIIPTLLKTPDDWKGEIGNLLSKKVEVESVEGKTVKIKSGTVTLNKNFIPFDRYGTAPRGNMAIWNLDGKVEFKNAPEIAHEQLFKKKKRAEGAAEVQLVDLVKFKTIIDLNPKNLMAFACATIDFAKKDTQLYEKLKILAVPNYVIFVQLIFGSVDKLFSATELSAFVQEYESRFANEPEKCDKSIFTLFVKEVEEINKKSGFEKQLGSHISMVERKAVNADVALKEILSIYGIVDQNNSMKFPESVATVFKNNKMLHPTFDMAAYLFGMIIEQNNNNHQPSIQAIRTYFDQKCNISFERIKRLFVESKTLVLSFVKSNYFLRFPGELKQRVIGSGEDDESESEESSEGYTPGIFVEKEKEKEKESD
jgi:hypothetical protein